MVAELVENISGWDHVRSALDEIRVCHDDTQTFFSGVFDQLDSLCETLLTRESNWQKPAAHAERRCLGNRDCPRIDRWDSLIREIEAGREEFRGTHQIAQEQISRISAAAEGLTAARNELQTARGELARQGEELSAIRSQSIAAWQEVRSSIKDKIREMDEQRSLLEKERAAMEKAAESNIQDKIHDVEQQQALLEKEREAMEKELASVGNKAEEIAGLLAEQKRASGPQQPAWAEDLLEMRAMLENLTRQVAQERRQTEPSAHANRQSGFAAAANSDPVLESVLAQFEVLQQDRIFRRSETTG